jgi:hypothetical protein
MRIHSVHQPSIPERRDKHAARFFLPSSSKEQWAFGLPPEDKDGNERGSSSTREFDAHSSLFRDEFRAKVYARMITLS